MKSINKFFSTIIISIFLFKSVLGSDIDLINEVLLFYRDRPTVEAKNQYPEGIDNDIDYLYWQGYDLCERALNRDNRWKLLDSFFETLSNKVKESINNGYTIDELIDTKLQFKSETYFLFPTKRLKILVLKNIEDFFIINNKDKLGGFAHDKIVQKIDDLQQSIPPIPQSFTGDSEDFFGLIELHKKKINTEEIDKEINQEFDHFNKCNSYNNDDCFFTNSGIRKFSNGLIIENDIKKIIKKEIITSIIAELLDKQNVCEKKFKNTTLQNECVEKLYKIKDNPSTPNFNFPSAHFKMYVFMLAYSFFYSTKSKPDFFKGDELIDLLKEQNKLIKTSPLTAEKALTVPISDVTEESREKIKEKIAKYTAGKPFMALRTIKQAQDRESLRRETVKAQEYGQTSLRLRAKPLETTKLPQE